MYLSTQIIWKRNLLYGITDYITFYIYMQFMQL